MKKIIGSKILLKKPGEIGTVVGLTSDPYMIEVKYQATIFPVYYRNCAVLVSPKKFCSLMKD